VGTCPKCEVLLKLITMIKDEVKDCMQDEGDTEANCLTKAKENIPLIDKSKLPNAKYKCGTTMMPSGLNANTNAEKIKTVIGTVVTRETKLASDKYELNVAEKVVSGAKHYEIEFISTDPEVVGKINSFMEDLSTDSKKVVDELVTTNSRRLSRRKLAVSTDVTIPTLVVDETKATPPKPTPPSKGFFTYFAGVIFMAWII